VFQENQWFHDYSMPTLAISGKDPDLESVIRLKKKRLMYLFVKDLSGGVCADVLSSKTQRDSLRMSMAMTKVSPQSRTFGWLFVAFLNLGLLFYVYLFAMQQTQSRQSAWFMSFVLWLVFEVFVSSTGLVLLAHLMIPMFVFTELAKIKEKVLKDLMIFREKHLKKQEKETKKVRGLSGANLEELPQINRRASEGEFNAAKYLYISWRVASLFREIPESELILQFRTPWPKMRFGGEDTELSSEYDQAIILTAASRIFLYFLGSFLHFHGVIQDIFLQILCNCGWGYVGLLLIRLSRVHRLLPVVPMLGILLCLHFLFRSGKSLGIVKKMNEQNLSLDLEQGVGARAGEGKGRREELRDGNDIEDEFSGVGEEAPQPPPSLISSPLIHLPLTASQQDSFPLQDQNSADESDNPVFYELSCLNLRMSHQDIPPQSDSSNSDSSSQSLHFAQEMEGRLRERRPDIFSSPTGSDDTHQFLAVYCPSSSESSSHQSA
jgi:hypothetical protein